MLLIVGKFKEDMFHPNVFPSGTVDLNFLTRPEIHWKASVTIMEVTAFSCLYQAVSVMCLLVFFAMKNIYA